MKVNSLQIVLELVFLFLLLPFLLGGQTDSLSFFKENYYQKKSEKDYQGAYDMANTIADRYKKENYDSSFHWHAHCYENAEKLKNTHLLVNSLSSMGMTQLNLRDFDKSVIYTAKADSILEIHPNNINSVRNLYFYGIGLEFTGRPEKAMRKFLECYEISESIGDVEMLTKLDNKFGNMKKVTEDYQGAMKHYKNAVKRLDSKVNVSLYWRTQVNLLNLIISFPDSFNNSEFLDACELVTEFKENVKDPETLYYCADFIDGLHVKCVLGSGSSKELKALPLISINEIQNKFSRTNDLAHQYSLNFDIALKQGKYKEAEKYMLARGKLAKNSAEKKGFLIMKKRILNVKQDYRALVPVLEELHKIELELDSDNRIESISNLEGVLSAKEKQHEVEVLNKQKELLAAKSAQNFTLALGTGALALLAFSFFYVARRNNMKIASKSAIISEKNKQLEQVNQTKDRIFAIIGHDLRKPVVAFSGISETINYLIKKEDYATLQQLGSEIEKDGFALQKLTDNLLNWALTQGSIMPYNPQEISLSNKAEEIILIFEKVARDKKIDLVNKVPKGTNVFADPNSLLTILINLVDNALKFTPNGGMVELGVNNESEGVKILVSDNGVGMSEEQMRNIFLLQKDKSQKGTSGEKGTGLGLHLVNELVKMNKGKIEAESNRGIGTAFRVLLPVNKQEAA